MTPDLLSPEKWAVIAQALDKSDEEWEALEKYRAEAEAVKHGQTVGA